MSRAAIVALAAIVFGGLALWAKGSGRASRTASPSREPWPDPRPDVEPGRPATNPSVVAVGRAEPQPQAAAEAPQPSPAEPLPNNEPEAPPAPPEAPAPQAKRTDVTPAALAAERSRIALAQLAPREDQLVRSGPPPAGAVPAWNSTADELRDELGRSLIANPGVRVSGVTCFQAGCRFSVDAADASADVQSRGRLKMLLRGETAHPFPGDNFVSGLVTRPDGYLRTTVILYAPAEPAGVP